jgi:S-adenosylmethionine uptake transporter
MSPNLVGALLMMASMACFVVSDAVLKMTAGALPLFQLLFLRGMISCALILVTKGRVGALHFDIARRDWIIIVIRGMTEALIAYFFLTALFHMPLANLTAILQCVPLTVTLASALFLREAVGWRRMLAIAVGFVGVLMIVKPGAEGFNIWSLYAVIAVLGADGVDRGWAGLVKRALGPG